MGSKDDFNKLEICISNVETTQQLKTRKRCRNNRKEGKGDIILAEILNIQAEKMDVNNSDAG